MHRLIVWATSFLLVAFTLLGQPQSAVAASRKCHGVKATIVGTKHADRIKGTSHRDVIVARGGADNISGLSGKDLICGGAGKDFINGGPGNDHIFGGRGVDTVLGKGGNDLLEIDRTPRGAYPGDSLRGGGGNDVLVGGTESDHLDGGSGSDRLSGGDGGDRLLGGAGDDYLVSGPNSTGTHHDFMFSEDGDDTYVAGTPFVILDLTRGKHGADIDLATGRMSGFGDDTLVGFHYIEGTHFTDTIRGSEDADWVRGNGGDDHLFGAGGDDDLFAAYLPGSPSRAAVYGDGGNDVVNIRGPGSRANGGIGDDFIGFANDSSVVGNPGNDTFRFYGSSGSAEVDGSDDLDTFYLDLPGSVDLSTGSASFGAEVSLINIENVHGSDFADTLIGDDGPNVIFGGDGDDTLSGLGDADVLIGELGSDTANGGDGTDSCDAEGVTACE